MLWIAKTDAKILFVSRYCTIQEKAITLKIMVNNACQITRANTVTATVSATSAEQSGEKHFRN